MRTKPGIIRNTKADQITRNTKADQRGHNHTQFQTNGPKRFKSNMEHTDQGGKQAINRMWCVMCLTGWK